MTSSRMLQLITNAAMVFILALTMVGSAAAQSNWYVNSTEGDDTNDGTQMNNGGAGVGPFATLAAAVASASDGDTIIILAGDYSGENLDLEDVQVTAQVQASGANTTATFLNLFVNDATSLSGGDGEFAVQSVYIDGATLTLDADILTVLGSGNEFYMYSYDDEGVVDGEPRVATIAGNAPVIDDWVYLYYEVDADDGGVDITTGLELQADGNNNGGEIYLNDGGSTWDNGTFTIDRNLTTDYLSFYGDVDVTFEGNLDCDDSIGTEGNCYFYNSGTVTVEGMLNVDGSIDFEDDIVAVVNGYATVADALNLTDDASATFNAGAQVSDLSVALQSSLTVDGTLTITGANVSHSSTGTLSATDLDLTEYDYVTTAAGNTTVSGTLTLGDDEDGGDRIVNAVGHTMSVGNIVIENNDDGGADGNGAGAETIAHNINNSGSFTLTGTVTEADIADADQGDDVISYVLSLGNADDAVMTFESTTTFSGDLENAVTGLGATEGFYVAEGATVTSAYDGAHTDLGYLGGDGTFEISEGTNAITTLSSASNFLLSAVREVTGQLVATGDVEIAANGVIVDDGSDITGGLTISGDDVELDTDADGASSTSSVGSLTVSGTGFVFGNNEAGGQTDVLDSAGSVDIGDATIDGSVTIDSGSFTADDGTVGSNLTITAGSATFSGTADVGGDLSLSDGNATFEDSATASGLVNVAGDVTIATSADVTWASTGDGDSDIEGALTVNGTLTLGDTNISLNDVTIVAPDGLLDADGTDLIIGGDYAGGSIENANVVTIQIPADGSSFAPGPNTEVVDFTVEGSGRTLTIGEGFEVTRTLTVENDATVALGDETINLSGANIDDEALVLNDEAAVTSNVGGGALAFSGANQDIVVAGAPSFDPTLTNIRVNNGAAVTVGHSIFISGDLSLNHGIFNVDADVTMTSDDATITRNPSLGFLDVADADLLGEWDVVYFGDTGLTGSELADEQTRNITVNMTDGQTLTFDSSVDATGDFVAQDGNIIFDTSVVDMDGSFTNHADADEMDVDGEMIVGGDFTITATSDPEGFLDETDVLRVGGSLTVPTDVVLAGGDVYLSGDATTHSVEGRVNSDLYVDAVTVTINGTSDSVNPDSGHLNGDTYVTSGGHLVVRDIQYMDDTYITDASVDINLIDGDATAELNNIETAGTTSIVFGGTTTRDDGVEMDDIYFYDETTFTMTSDVDMYYLGMGDSVDDVTTLNLEGYRLTVTDDDVDGFDGASISISEEGVFEYGYDGCINIYGETIPNLTTDGENDWSLCSDLVVGNFTMGAPDDDSDLDLSGNQLTITNSMTMGDSADLYDGLVVFTGTDVTVTLLDDAWINEMSVQTTGQTQFVGSGGIYSIDAFEILDGSVSFGDNDLEFQGTFDYLVENDDSFIQGDSEIYLSGVTMDLNDQSVTMGNVVLEGTVDLSNDGGDNLTLVGDLTLDGGDFVTNDGDPLTDNSTVTIADNVTVYVNDAGVPAYFEERPTFLGGNLVYYYNGGGGTTSGNELAEVVSELHILTGPVSVGAGPAAVSVTTALNLDASLSDVGRPVTLEDDGTVYWGADAEAPGTITYGDNITVVVDGVASIGSGIWPASLIPATITFANNTVLPDNRTVVDATVDAEVDLGGVGSGILSVTGDLTVTSDGSFVTAADAYVSMSGSDAQTLTVNGGAPADLEIDNTAGVTLSGSDLDFATTAGTLMLTSGPLNTGDNAVILSHGGTGSQGYTRVDGVVNGNVQKYIETSEANPNRIEFPTGSANGDYRPIAVTFNDPAGDIGDIQTWNGVVVDADILMSVSYGGDSPGGTNGLPITTQDSEGNDLSIGRYPDFHWSVSSSPTVSPSVDYDVEVQAANYDNFENEDIERTRLIRRADGSTDNFWILTSPAAADNDNYAISATEPVAVSRGAVGAISQNGVLFTFGLEQNMVAAAMAPLTLNAGNEEEVDLLTVFSGGDESYTYECDSSAEGVATVDCATDALTVTAVAAGTADVTVVATDGFGDTATAMVSVTVNPVFANGTALADVTVNEGTADVDLEVSGIHVGGTPTYSYTAESEDPAVVAVSVTGSVVTHTFVGAGEATITVTATDSEGDEVEEDFLVTVNANVSVVNPLDDLELTQGDDYPVDVSAVFEGGTGTLSVSAESADCTVVCLSPDGSTLTVSALAAYAGGVDTGSIDVTVTATDSLGGSISDTFSVLVNPVLGAVSGGGTVGAFDASLILDEFLGKSDPALTAKQLVAADYDEDSDIDPYDAYQVYVLAGGLPKSDVRSANPAADVAFGDMSQNGSIISIPVVVTGDVAEAGAISFSTTIPAVATVVEIVNASEWMMVTDVAEDGTVRIAAIGGTSLPSDGMVATINISIPETFAAFTLSGEGAVNNNTISAIDAVEVIEIPDTFALDGNYPNPFNPTTTIQFDLPESADVEVQIFDMIGRQVMSIPSQTIAAGAKRSLQVNASQLASGSYFYRVVAKMKDNVAVDTGRMTLVK